MFSSGNNTSRGNAMLSSDMPPLPQCLPLEPITLSNQKFTRSGELRRVLGYPLGSTAEDHSLVVAHSKLPPPVASEDLKHFKESVLDTSRKARDRLKMFRESLFKLDKYREAMGPKKRQRTDLLSNERSGGANLSKMGSQIHGNSLAVATQRLEDRAKCVGLNKRVRTSIADGRQADGLSTSILRQQMVMQKDKNMVRAASGGPVQIEEKIRRLPDGGEGWDKKMKKKRSVGAVVNRVINGDRDLKQAMNLKLGADSKLRSCDTHGFRLRSCPGVDGNNRLDDSFEPASSNTCTVLRNELESSPPKDRTTVFGQLIVAKGNNKKTIDEDNPVDSPSMVLKGKVSRARRSGSVAVVDSPSDVHPSSGALEGWEQPTSVNIVPVLGLVNNNKRPLPTKSSSHPMAQWSGQRPHKISRTRRANLVSPVSNHVEAKSSSKGFANCDINARITSDESNGSVISSGVDNNAPKFKMELKNKLKIVPSSVGLSESEESGAGESKLKGKGTESGKISLSAVHKVPPRRNRMLVKEEIGDGVQRQGRSGRGFFLTKAGVTPVREKLENLPMKKALQSTRSGSDKNRSKLGRPPSKKLTDRKAKTQAGQMQNSGFSDFTGESDDDHEELLAAANSAHNASKLACSGPFWKKVESIFSPLSLEDTSYLKQQLCIAEEQSKSQSQMFDDDYNILGVLMQKEVSLYYGEKQGSHTNQESAKNDAPCGKVDMGRRSDKITSLYQRVLSALIEEDESEEFYHHGEGNFLSFQCASDDSHCGSCNHNDVEPKDEDRMESEVESKVDFLTQQNCSLDRFSSDKSAASNPLTNPSMCNSSYNNERWQGDDVLSHSDVGFVNEISQNGLDVLQSRQKNISGISSFDCQYKLMCLDDRLLLELQSIGLHPDMLPDLVKGEEVINQDIVELKEGLYQQVGKKKTDLGKIDKAIQAGRDVERRDIEHVAMNQLLEMAYKKLMACRGSNASKSVIRMATKQSALTFLKRTLARSRKLEETSRSCFSDPALQDVIFYAPPCSTESKSVDCVGSGTASNTYNEVCNHQIEARGSAVGADSRTLERCDSYSDNLDRGCSDAIHAIITRSSEQAFSKHEPVLDKEKKREVSLDDVVGSTSSREMSAIGSTALGGVKGKRSERDGDLNTDILTSNSVSRAGHSSLGSFRGERKTKAKPKQKINLLSATENGLRSRFTESTDPACPSVRGSTQLVANDGNNKIRKGVGLPSPVGSLQALSKEEETINFSSLQLPEFDSIEELGVSNDTDGHQDLSSWLNLDEDSLLDHDSIGLEIPMDDLTELSMII